MTALEITGETTSFKTLATAVFKDDGLEVFRLEDVTIQGSERDELDLSKAVRGHPALKEFTIKNAKVGEESLNLDGVISMLLVTAVKLEKLHLENCSITSSALATLGYCSTLKELKLVNLSLKDSDAGIIAGGVAQSQSIKTIDLSGNDMSDLGCVAFKNALDKNTSLCTLSLNGNSQISSENLGLIESQLRNRAANAA